MMLRTTTAVLAALCLTSAAAQDGLSEAIEKDYEADLETLFRHFHENPELSFRESETAKRLADELRDAGFSVTEGVGRTGVVAVYENGEGPTVMIRADMDGLPVKEQSGLSYSSNATQEDLDGEVKPVMHACGHDVHMTALVGAARQLMARKDQWSGTLVLIGQPAEERISGAREMLEDGLYEKFPKPDYALALHVASDLPAGVIQVPKENAFSSSDSVDVYVYGIGGHGASPHETVDPVLVASQIVVSLQSVVSRSIPPKQPGVITVGAIHGGTKHNIIGEEVHLQLTVRSNDPETRTTLLDGIDRVARGTALALGVPEDRLPKVERSKSETTPPTNNDPETAERVEAAITQAMGEDILFEKKDEGMGAEDFAYFVTPESGVKGVYFIVGGAREEDAGKPTAHHSPGFRIAPEPSVTKGAEALVVSAIELLGDGETSQGQ